MKAWIARLVVTVSLLALPAASARAQGDGPRVYQIVPAGTYVVSVYGLSTRGKLSDGHMFRVIGTVVF